jgi:hypothetical protein
MGRVPLLRLEAFGSKCVNNIPGDSLGGLRKFRAKTRNIRTPRAVPLNMIPECSYSISEFGYGFWPGNMHYCNNVLLENISFVVNMVKGGGENYIKRSYMISNLRQV